MNFKKERLMMSEEETRKRAKELLSENQADLITKYMFLEQQVKKQKEVIDKAIEYIDKEIYYCLSSGDNINIYLDKLSDILKEGENEYRND